MPKAKSADFLAEFKLLCKEINSQEEECSIVLEGKDCFLIQEIKTELLALVRTLETSFQELAKTDESLGDSEYSSYIGAKRTARCVLSKLSRTLAELSVPVSGRESEGFNNLKLPTFELPEFKGEYSNWLSYKEIFEGSVGANSSLTDIQKFQYLKSSLKGDAARLISGFAITSANYQEAWDTLRSRYDDKRELAYAQCSKFFHLKSVKVPTSRNILELLDTSNEAIRNLRSLGFEICKLSNVLLVYYLKQKLDDSLTKQWELQVSQVEEFPTYEVFAAFLERQARCIHNSGNMIRPNQDPKLPVRQTITCAAVEKQITACILCKQGHKLHTCSRFKSMSLKERWNCVKKYKCCYNCLRNNHTVLRCLFTTNCQACHKKHHTLLHEFEPMSLADSNQPAQSFHAGQDSATSNTFYVSESETSSQVLLSTAIVKVKNNQGGFCECRALLDSGSQKSLIAEGCCQKLGLPLRKINHSIIGINDLVANVSSAQVTLRFSPYFGGSCFSTTALVVDRLSSRIPNFEFPITRYPSLGDVKLADPEFNKSRPIDVILGADIFFDLIEGERISRPTLPTVIRSKLGWILTGRVSLSKQGKKGSIDEVMNCHTNVDLSTVIKRFWELESVSKEEREVSDDEICEEFYNENAVRDETGRYTVRLPFKSNPNLGESKSQAVRRFLSLEKRMQKDPKLSHNYINFMKEYESLGHMEVVPKADLSKPPSEHYYMPHHGVVREQSSTTKLRVVFDASAKTSTGVSLNQTLHSGGRLQQDLFDILIRFRTHAIVLTADIAKMFRQIQIDSNQFDYQRIVWRESPSQELKDYRLTTVTYGTSCAPFLAIRTVQQLAREEKSEFPIAAEIALRDFYVDDLLTGASSTEEAGVIVKQMIALFQRGGFQLRKWMSNDADVMEELPMELRGRVAPVQFDDTQFTKILGILWDPTLDNFRIQVSQSPTEELLTKRQVLSHIARIYDPLGFLAPTTIVLKIMMQKLWKEHTNWDEPLTEAYHSDWKKLRDELCLFNQLNIPRFLMKVTAPTKGIELHGFCDASSKAYSALCYLRSEFPDGQFKVSLICAKTKVAPLKSTTIPRLELSAALLLGRLYRRLCQALCLNLDGSFLWTDSEIVLCWLKSNSLKWKPFVANRVSQIQELTQSAQWNHISGKENPADCASRGIMPSKLLENELWWKGPSWLVQGDLPKSPDPEVIANHEVLELRKSVVSNQSIQVPESPNFISKFSSFVKLKRVTAWCLRFVRNVRSQENHTVGPLTSKELGEAVLRLVKIVQNIEFQSEIRILQRNQALPTTSRYLSLSPFLDSQSLLRVGGRLKHSSLSWTVKHPLLLPKNNHYTNLIINHFHMKYFHAGPQLVLSMIRQQFWIPSGRSAIRKVLNLCVTCFRLRAQSEEPLMGNLPAPRVIPSRPFQRTGIDLAGPIITKPNVKRSKIKLKSYVVLFVCFVTKAVHLEVVSNLSASAFLAAFRRFIARRGKPTDVYSDNATNFKGASNYLKEQHELCNSEEVKNVVSEEGINWHFIPPQAPHFGGLWESNIKSMKQHLTKTCKAAILNFEELTTLIAQIEACLNSRPLTAISTDPNELEPLTPGHFLVGSPLTAAPEAESQLSRNLGVNWQGIQVLRTQFWKRWSQEYLTSLQPRSKWKNSTSGIVEGDLVLVKDEVPVMKWCLARITRLFPGDDGITRVVELKTPSGLFKRPVKKLCRLPIEGTGRGL